MKILIATSEATPFAKTGGLADVCGALPGELARLGHEVALIMPGYRRALASGAAIEDTGVGITVPIGRKQASGRYLRGELPGTNVPVYFVDQPSYFDRDGLYGEGGHDYDDNCERFVFFSRAVVEAVEALSLWPDVVHLNDWQTGLVPAYLKIEGRDRAGYERLTSLLTIHNISYQGQFWHWDMLLTGLDWKYFNWHQMEFFGKLNLLKTGLVFADAVNTVSPRYAEEIQSAPLGCGLEGVLHLRRDVLSGIINGVDYGEWNPATDRHLPANYDAEHVQPGKGKCKQALQEELGLAVDPKAPLIGFVGRLVDQKGIDLVLAAMQEWAAGSEVQWAILGTGEPHYHELLSTLARRFPRKVAARLEFSDPLARRIEAGADIFLMPSRFEPCGLNQLYSLKYGAVPLVRATGGLADTITNATEQTLAARTANGFSFHDYSTLALSETLRRTCDLYLHHPEVWAQLLDTGMHQDWSWSSSARQYVELYGRTRARARVLATA
ncbi:MAG: glycogen synthase GlgA [Pirellulales bacterium]